MMPLLHAVREHRNYPCKISTCTSQRLLLFRRSHENRAMNSAVFTRVQMDTEALRPLSTSESLQQAQSFQLWPLLPPLPTFPHPVSPPSSSLPLCFCLFLPPHLLPSTEKPHRLYKVNPPIYIICTSFLHIPSRSLQTRFLFTSSIFLSNLTAVSDWHDGLKSWFVQPNRPGFLSISTTF